MSLPDLARAHAELNKAVQDIYGKRAALILHARAAGHTWREIADTLGMTIHGAMKASRMGSEDRG